jgi:hypothetical protein
MTRGGKLVANHPFRLWTDYVKGSGGHIHGVSTDSARRNTNDNFGYFIVGQSTKRPLDTLTNANGKFATEYYASLFGDTMRIYLKSRNMPLLFDSISVVEKVDSLIKFPSGTQWTFAQSPEGTTRHPDNNWFTQKMVDSLQAAIKDFYNWSLSEEGGGTPIIISLNDMSLKLGGRLDMDALWDRSTKPDKPKQRHYYHRTGKSVDINNGSAFKVPDPKDSTKTILTPRGRKLQEYMNRYQGTIYEEPQIHFDFP